MPLQRLLGNERIRADGAGVNLVRHQVSKFHHVDVAHDNFLVEGFARASVNQLCLAVLRQFGVFEIAANVFFLDAVENRRRKFQAEQSRRPTQVRFQHLADVHARRHAQRVQDNVHRSAVREERHIFFRHDLGHNALVAVASRHFVADRQFALGRDINFDRLDHAAIDFLAGFRAFEFFVVLHLQIVELLFESADDFVDLVANRRRIDFDAIIDLRQFARAASW